MASLGDAVVQFPISGSYSPPDAVMRVTNQVMSATLTVLTASQTSQLLLPANSNRRALMFRNASPVLCYVRFGGPTADSYNHSVAIGDDDVIYPYQFAPAPTSEIHVVWDTSAAASGSLKITEFT